MHGAWIGLGTGHEGLDADIDGEAAFDASEDVAREDEDIVGGFIEVVPDAEAGGFGVRKQDVAFDLFAAVDHDIDDVAAMDGDLSGSREELIEIGRASCRERV